MPVPKFITQIENAIEDFIATFESDERQYLPIIIKDINTIKDVVNNEILDDAAAAIFGKKIEAVALATINGILKTLLDGLGFLSQFANAEPAHALAEFSAFITTLNQAQKAMIYEALSAEITKLTVKSRKLNNAVAVQVIQHVYSLPEAA